MSDRDAKEPGELPDVVWDCCVSNGWGANKDRQEFSRYVVAPTVHIATRVFLEKVLHATIEFQATDVTVRLHGEKEVVSWSKP